MVDSSFPSSANHLRMENLPLIVFCCFACCCYCYCCANVNVIYFPEMDFMAKTCGAPCKNEGTRGISSSFDSWWKFYETSCVGLALRE